jgi:hypothetical protein
VPVKSLLTRPTDGSPVTLNRKWPRTLLTAIFLSLLSAVGFPDDALIASIQISLLTDTLPLHLFTSEAVGNRPVSKMFFQEVCLDVHAGKVSTFDFVFDPRPHLQHFSLLLAIDPSSSTISPSILDSANNGFRKMAQILTAVISPSSSGRPLGSRSSRSSRGSGSRSNRSRRSHRSHQQHERSGVGFLASSRIDPPESPVALSDAPTVVTVNEDDGETLLSILTAPRVATRLPLCALTSLPSSLAGLPLLPPTVCPGPSCDLGPTPASHQYGRPASTSPHRSRSPSHSVPPPGTCPLVPLLRFTRYRPLRSSAHRL